MTTHKLAIKAFLLTTIAALAGCEPEGNMSTKPTDLAPWATVANYPMDSSPEQGTATKVAYGSGKSDYGFRPSEEPTAEELNDWLHRIGNWVQYLSDGDLDGPILVDASIGGMVVSDHGAPAAAYSFEVDGDALITTLTVTNPIKHGNFTKRIPLVPADISGSYTFSGTNINPWLIQLSSGSLVWHLGIPLEVGEQLVSAKVLGGNGGATVVLRKAAPGLFFGGFGEVTTSGSIGSALAAPGTYVSGDCYMLTSTFTNTDSPTGVEIVYTRT